MQSRAFRVVYDGRPFHGFQRQPHARTVEGELLAALADLGIVDRDANDPDRTHPDPPPGYAAAGRTDAGVSAVGQTIAFEAPDWLTPRAFNSGGLPAGIRVWASVDVPDGFHATHDAVERTYRYHLYAPETGVGTGTDAPIDDGAVREALERLSGDHDFHNFTSDESGTERDVDATARRDDDFLVFEVTAGGFPRSLVRRLVGLARDVGRGAVPISRVDRALEPEPLPGPQGIAPAPPEPLVLWDVDYDGVSFAIDGEAAETGIAAFGERYVRARHAGAALGSILGRLREAAPDRTPRER